MYTSIMMKALHTDLEVGVRDLRANLSRYLAEVARGTSLVVTDRGRPVARLVALDQEPPGLQRLIDAGRIRLPERAASDPGTWRRPAPRRPVAPHVADQRR